MKDLIKKYRKNRLSRSELEETRKRLDSLSDEQLGRELYNDWHDFEPETLEESPTAETDVYRRLQTMLIKPDIRRRRIMFWAGVAAVFMIAVTLSGAIYFYMQNNALEAMSTIVATAASDRATVSLPDGSSVALNGNSSVEYTLADFKDGLRMIEFHGEGYIDVAKDKTSPFIIKSHGLEVTVYGTTFDLSAREDSGFASLYLIDGAVTMRSTLSNRSVTLNADQKAVLNYTTGAIEVEKIDVNDNPLAWKSRRLIFRNAPLATVISNMEKYYDCKFRLDSAISDESFTGMVPLDNIDMAVAVIEKTFHTGLAPVGKP